MKKWIITLLLLLTLSGCGLMRQKQTVTFYYPRQEYLYHGSDTVIGKEVRDITGHSELQYLLEIYMLGPSDEKLISPFPAGTNILSIEDRSAGLVITLSDSVISDSGFTLGSYCLCRVCAQLREYETVTVISGSRSLTLRADDFTTRDYDFQNEPKETGGK